MSDLKVFGYPDDGVDRNSSLPMCEVTFQASPEILREIAKFLEFAAVQIEAGADHLHLSDESAAHPEGAPDVIAFRPL